MEQLQWGLVGRDGRGSTYAVHPAANPERVYDPPPEVADSDSCVVVEFLGDDGVGNAGAVVRFLAGLLPILVSAFSPCFRTEAGAAGRATLLNSLELPYRVVRGCVGDLGAPAYKKYDTETWFPSFGAYRETHSNGNLTDYQARRFKIRFRGEGGMVFAHTISATGITDRAALAILENYVEPDGSIVVPKVLRSYLGGMDRIQAPSRS